MIYQIYLGENYQPIPPCKRKDQQGIAPKPAGFIQPFGCESSRFSCPCYDTAEEAQAAADIAIAKFKEFNHGVNLYRLNSYLSCYDTYTSAGPKRLYLQQLTASNALSFHKDALPALFTVDSRMQPELIIFQGPNDLNHQASPDSLWALKLGQYRKTILP